MTRKTGILGGTFDPVHNGHLALAEAAGKLCDLDEITLLPAAVPPHKQEVISAFSDRVAMLELAVRNKPTLTLSTIEQLLPTPSYSIDTLRYLLSHATHPAEFFFITGADTFLDILSWKEYQELLRTIHFVVFSRVGSKNEQLYTLFNKLEYHKKGAGWYNTVSHRWIYCSSVSLPPVSSSEIRNRVALGLPVNSFVPEGVSEYIQAHGLYTVR
ncbi:MAG: nicotinate-nucleotide adenylyltransferase [Proteobacteria bacterium]|nr:nicotinate-nucleotide adenylyltransferase [Pseudomonadota bacterium]MBU1232593.1 nicotinate-nucleotide adenylyltransferase [Pseudomonadota bacterium]MBU1417048.1 nicotinate-nucleotide adenylyltransferase [Pseudomonadota bacterium]MBU1453744.1 nicotinate-nucleotide adenylyltransferase [Pseudomonadota bacterium]